MAVITDVSAETSVAVISKKTIAVLLYNTLSAPVLMYQLGGEVVDGSSLQDFLATLHDK